MKLETVWETSTTKNPRKRIKCRNYVGSKSQLGKSLQSLAGKLSNQGYECWLNEHGNYYRKTGWILFVYLKNVTLEFSFSYGLKYGEPMSVVKESFWQAFNEETTTCTD